MRGLYAAENEMVLHGLYGPREYENSEGKKRGKGLDAPACYCNERYGCMIKGDYAQRLGGSEALLERK